MAEFDRTPPRPPGPEEPGEGSGPFVRKSENEVHYYFPVEISTMQQDGADVSAIADQVLDTLARQLERGRTDRS